MKRIEGAGWMVLVLALMGVTVGTSRPSAGVAKTHEEAPTAKRHAEASTEEEEGEGENGEGPEPSAPVLAAALLATVEAPLKGSITSDQSPEEIMTALENAAVVSAVVVSLPDPRHGNQGRYFDQGIDALRRGAQAHGYSQVEFFLPSAAGGGESEDPHTGCLDCLCGHCQSPEADEPSEPYFIVFSRGQELLVCLLTLESPVQGPTADLTLALDIARQLGGPGAALRVVGPFFSGSARILGARIAQFRADADAPVQVVSGTATAPGIGNDIAIDGGVTFRRTTPNDEDVLAFLTEAIARRHDNWTRPLLGPPKIALLREFDTGFGQNLEKVGQATFSSFGYPSSISSVRHVRQQQKRKTEEVDNGDPLSLRRTMQLDLAPVEDAEGDLPPLLSQITPFERELELGEQLTRICRERYDYLILTATDPLDLVFLADEARKYCPGLTLIALGAEKIFRHPDVRSSLDGLLVVGSYPLLFEVPPWGTTRERPFASHVAQGFYNAWLTILNEAEPGSDVPLLDYQALGGSRSCIAARGQPLWLTALAGGTFWPLRTSCVDSPDGVREAELTHDSVQQKASQPAARITGVIRAAGLLLLSLAFAQVLWMRRPAMLELQRHALGARYRMGANLTLFLVLALVTPSVLEAPNDPGAAPWLRLAYWVSVVPVFTLLGYLGAYFASDARAVVAEQQLLATSAWQGDRRATSISAAALLTFGVAFLLLSSAWLVHHCSLPSLERRMVLTRMYNPIGMSPLAPVTYLALAYYAWSFIGISRVRALIRFSDRSPLPLRNESLMVGDHPLSSGSTLTPALDSVVSTLSGAWSGSLWRYEILAAGLAAVPGAYFCLRVRPSWEGSPYDWLIKVSLIVLYGMVIVASVHFLTLVSLLRRFLRQLAALPMVDSYDRVSVKMKSSFGIQFGVRVPAFEELQLSGYSSTLLERLMAAEIDDTEPPSTRPGGTPSSAPSDPADPAETPPPDVQAGTSLRTSDSNNPEPQEDPPPREPEGGEASDDLPDSYLRVFKTTYAAFAPRTRDVNDALTAFRHAAMREVEIESRGHLALYGASRALFVILRKLWALRAREPVMHALAEIDRKDLLPGGELAELPTVAIFAGAVPRNLLLWMRVAEDFVTLRIATFLGHVMTHLRYLLAFTLAASLLLILAVSSYPLEPTRFVTVFSWTLMLTVIGLAFVVIVRMERNEVLSRLSGSTPGQIDFNFALAGQLIVYVGLPLLAVLANIFPEIRDQLFAWAGPVRRLLP